MMPEAIHENHDKAFLKKARQDVEAYLRTPTTILPEFPTTMTVLHLDTTQAYSALDDSARAREIAEVLGKMYMMGALADILTTMFADDGGVVGSSSWIRDVLISETTRVAIADRFHWTSPKISKAAIVYHMMAALHDCETIETGEEDLERWAGEFFRQLARVAKKTRSTDTKGAYTARVHLANDLENDKRPLAVVQMQDYLRRMREAERKELGMVPGWVEDHHVIKDLLRGDI